MATFSKIDLSGATTGKGIKVVATGTPGTLIHAAVSGTSDWDEVYIYVMNNDTVDRQLIIEWGGVATPDDLIKVTVPFESGLLLVIPGFVIQNSLDIRAFCPTANVLIVHGFVNRITA